MFIKCTSIILYIISLVLVIFFSFQFSLEIWEEGNNPGFVLMMILILVLLILLVIAFINLSSTIKAWRGMKAYKKETDKILE
jgi:hypothetical protein